MDRERQELMIALIPHIVRRPEYTAENLRGIAVGSQQSVHLSYGRARMPRRRPPAPKTGRPPAPRLRRPRIRLPPIRRWPP